MNGSTSTGIPHVRPLTVAAIALTTILACAILGALTNAINGMVSSHYYITILNWKNVQNVWAAIIAQGIFEGLCFGVFFSLIFTAGVGIITRASCSYSYAVKYLSGIATAALACWAVGGIAAMSLAWLSPDFYRQTFYGVPEEFAPMLGYAWVGGSIWGLQMGGLLSVVLGLIVLRSNWLRTT